MLRAKSATGVLRGAVTFMAANVLFFALGAGDANHNQDGVPEPKKPQLTRFIVTTDIVLMLAALLGAVSALGTTSRAIGSSVFAAGALIGAVEGVPKTLQTLKNAFA